MRSLSLFSLSYSVNLRNPINLCIKVNRKQITNENTIKCEIEFKRIYNVGQACLKHLSFIIIEKQINNQHFYRNHMTVHMGLN